MSADPEESEAAEISSANRCASRQTPVPMRVGSAYACRGFCLGRKRRLIIGDPNPCRFIEAPESAGLGLALLGPNRPERLGSGWLCG